MRTYITLLMALSGCTPTYTDKESSSTELQGTFIAPEKQCPPNTYSLNLFKMPEVDGCECGVIDCNKDAYLGVPKTKSLANLKACIGVSTQCRFIFADEDCNSDEIRQSWQTVDDGRLCACGCDAVTRKPFSSVTGTLNTSSIITSCCK